MDEVLDMLRNTDTPGQHPLPPNVNRACGNCARAKSKCIFDNNNERGKCQRCSRLQKQCEPMAARSRPPTKKRKIISTSERPRVEKIEEKLDGLISLLKTNREATIESDLVDRDNSVESNSDLSTASYQPYLTFNPVPRKGSYGLLRLGNQPLDGVPPYTPQPSHPVSEDSQTVAAEKETINVVPFFAKYCRPSVPAAFLDTNKLLSGFGEQEAHRLLVDFKVRRSAWFPFTSVSESRHLYLRQERPFLLSSILAVSCQDVTRQRDLGEELVKQIMERVFVRNERTKDLLLSLLNYTGWCCYNFFSLTRTTGLSAAMNVLVRDLVLDKAIETAACAPKMQLPSSLEEKRVFMGCFYMSSITSIQFHRYDSLAITDYLDECCQEVEVTGSLGDKYASAIVNIQILTERIAQAPWNRKSSLGTSYSVPVMLIVKTLQAQLNALKSRLSPDILPHPPITIAFHAAEIMIYRVGFAKATIVADSNMLGLQRVEVLCACHTSVVALFKAFLAIPETDYQYLTFPMYMQLAQGFMALSSLSKFEHDYWNMSYLLEPLELCNVMSSIADRFEGAAHALGVQQNDDSDKIHTYVLNTRKIRWVRDSYRTMIISKSAPESKSDQQDPSGGPITEAPTIDNSLAWDTNDEAWFCDWMGSGDYQDLF